MRTPIGGVVPDADTISFTCDCGRHVVCEEHSRAARARRCSRCRLRARREAASLERRDARAPRR